MKLVIHEWVNCGCCVFQLRGCCAFEPPPENGRLFVDRTGFCRHAVNADGLERFEFKDMDESPLTPTEQIDLEKIVVDIVVKDLRSRGRIAAAVGAAMRNDWHFAGL